VFLDVGITTLRFYILALLHWSVVIYVGIASLVSSHICWHCYTGEWSLHVGIAIVVSVPRCWYCYTGEWSLHGGIAILASGPYMLALLY